MSPRPTPRPSPRPSPDARVQGRSRAAHALRSRFLEGAPTQLVAAIFEEARGNPALVIEPPEPVDRAPGPRPGYRSGWSTLARIAEDWEERRDTVPATTFLVGRALLGALDEEGRSAAAFDPDSGLTTEAWEREVANVLARLDPPGVAARNLGECLAVQLEALSRSGDLSGRELESALDLVGRLENGECLTDHPSFETVQRLLGRGSLRFPVLARDESVPLQPRSPRGRTVECIRVRIDRVSRRAWVEEAAAPDPWTSRLRTSAAARAFVERGVETPGLTRAHVDRARVLLKALQERTPTVHRVVELVCAYQFAFLASGPALDDRLLRPLSRTTIARRMNCDPSTVARIVKERALDLSWGADDVGGDLRMPLRDLFSAALPHAGTVSTRALRAVLLEELSREPPGDPRSDEALARRAGEELGVSVARRTVSKYRRELGFPGVRRRRRG